MKTQLLRLNMCIEDALETNDKLGLVAAACNESDTHYRIGSTVNLYEQSNYVCLSNIRDDGDGDVDPSLVKQRSSTWIEIRSKAKVTGSTMYKALGLSTLKEQKQHKEKINNNSLGEEIFSPETIKAMKHGTENELNGVGVIVSKVIPIYEPSTTFFEEGCYMIERNTDKNFMVISPDGSCRVDGIPSVAIEIKCSVPGKVFTTDVHYTIPNYYVCQILSEMYALKCDKLFYVCWTPKSFTLLRALFDNDLWTVLTDELERVYNTDNGIVNIPKRKSVHVPTIKSMIAQYCAEKVELVAEFPASFCRPCSHTSAVDSKMCARSNHSGGNSVDWQMKQFQLELKNVTQTLLKAGKTHEEIYELLRTPGKEVLVTVLSDLDRKQERERVHAIPVAYGIAGYSLSSENVRSILEHVTKSCQERGLEVRALSSDGQFYKLCVRNYKDEPLTVLQVAKDTWAKIRKLSKSEEISRLMSTNKIMENDTVDKHVDIIETIDGSRTLFVGPINVYGIVGKDWKQLYNPPKLRQLLTSKYSKQNTSTDVQNLKELDCLSQDIINDIEKNNEDEDDIDQTMLINEEISEYQKEYPDEHNELDVFGEPIDLDLITPKVIECSNQRTIDYDQMINDLKKFDKDRKKSKWSNLCESELKKLLSSHPDVVKGKFTKKELGTCALYLQADIEKHSDITLADMSKIQLVNAFSNILGSKTIIKLTKKKSPKSLRNILKDFLSQKFGKEILNAVVATDEFLSNDLPNWRKKSVFKDGITIGTSSEPYIWYSQPEFFPCLGRHIFYLLDCHHLFVNARCFVVQHGISGLNVSRNAWLDVATNDRETHVGLNIAMVEDVIDKQSNALAQLTFSRAVEAEMRKLEYFHEAEFCKTIREWYMAEDEPGLDVMERHQYRIAMRNMLLGSTKLAEFPPPGLHVAGMPIVMFEGILSNIDRRIQLYSLIPGNSYNVRAPNTLDAENLFSEFRDVNPKSTGCLMAGDIPIALETASYIMQTKLNPDRAFVMNTAKRVRVYPENTLQRENEITEDLDRTTQFYPDIQRIPMRNHIFDLDKRKTRKPRRKSVLVPAPDQPARGTKPIRQHHKTDSSKIMCHKRFGLKDI